MKREVRKGTSKEIMIITPPRTWDRRLADAISKVGSPPVLASTTMASVASTLPVSSAWLWAGVYILLAILTPFFYVIWLVRRGLVTDLDVQLREQRTRPLIFTIACTGLAWLVLKLGRAPYPMIVLAGALWLQILILFGVTLRWKISVHVAAAAGAATVAWIFFQTLPPLLVGMPIVAWSRVHLRRHTVFQTIGGALLGLAIFSAAALLITQN